MFSRKLWPARSLRPVPAALMMSAVEADADGRVRITLAGEIDITRTASLAAVVAAALSEHEPTRMRVDLARVSYLDCAAVRTLLEARAAADEQGCELTAVNPQPIVLRLLQLTGAAVPLCGH